MNHPVGIRPLIVFPTFTLLLAAGCMNSAGRSDSPSPPPVSGDVAAAATTETRPLASRAVLRDGRLYLDGEHVFLKVGKPLRNFADENQVGGLIRDIPLLRDKGYNALAINCYWHHFDRTGDGGIDASLEPLNRLIHAIDAAGMFPCLSIETYGVGGGQIPDGFWKVHPGAMAINHLGDEVRDVEYGFNTAVPSIHSVPYQETGRRFIRNLVSGINARYILYAETTVEPQYMGHFALDYSENARRAFEEWGRRSGTALPPWPVGFPVSDSFVENPVWNRFRAEALADWVNGDAAAFREASRPKLLIAVDYLETCMEEMPLRNGDSVHFLTHLTSADIIQVNWTWNLATRGLNACAYANVREAMRRNGRNWAITEHMTLNGSDFQPHEVSAILRNTLRNGTLFGWEFVNVGQNSNDPFCLYHSDWSAKPLIAEVDARWDEWMAEVRRRVAEMKP